MTDESLLQFFFHLDRVIAWLNEVATVAHNNTSRRLGLKNHRIITSELNLGWEHQFQAFLTWFRRKNDLGEVEKRTKEKTEQTAYIKATCELFGVRNRSENEACFWIISPLKLANGPKLLSVSLQCPVLHLWKILPQFWATEWTFLRDRRLLPSLIEYLIS